ncbi:MAG: Imm1 family immunity protein [Planctomycetota bacterium]
MKNWQVHTGSKVANLEVIDITDEAALTKILDEFTEWDDPCIRLYKPDGDRLESTVKKPYALVQYMKASCEPPFLVGTDQSKKDSTETFEFVYDVQTAQVPARFCLSLDKMKEISLHFYNNGELPDSVVWEEIGRAEEQPD